VGATIAATAGLVLGGLAAATGAAAGSPTGSGQAGTVRTIHRVGSIASFPSSTKHRSAGAINLTEDGDLQRFVNRSLSPRPQTTRTARGNVVLRAQQQGTANWVPTVQPTSVSSGKPGTVGGWEGLNEYDNGVYAGFSLEPPDQGLCAGNGYVLEMINDVTRVYTSGGKALKTAYLNDFFAEAGYQFTTDPSCVYDAGSGRFYATQLTLGVDKKSGNLTGKSWLDLAVSKTGNPTGGYNIYRIYTTDDGTNGTPKHKDCPCLGDYPHLATDAHGVYLTTNEYPFSDDPGLFGNNFNGAQVYAISKTTVAAGADSVKVVDFQNVTKPTGDFQPRRPGFTLLPAQSAGTHYDLANNGTVNFVSTMAAEEARPDDFTGHGYNIAFWWIANTASLDTTPNLRLMSKMLSVRPYGLPPVSEQKQGPTPLKDCLNVGCQKDIKDQYQPEQEGPLDSSDTRTMTSYYANGQVYAALDTAMTVSGNVQAGFEWFAIKAADRNSSLAGNGYVGVTGNNLSYPAVATDPSGRGYLGVTLSGSGYYPSAAYMSFDGRPGGAVSVAGLGQAPEDGFCEYLFFDCAQTTPTAGIRPRWGDYGYAAWDGSKFYVANEYIAHSCDYSAFYADTTCGGTRTFYGNFSTHIQVLK
jgi:hypothetical protein